MSELREIEECLRKQGWTDRDIENCGQRSRCVEHAKRICAGEQITSTGEVVGDKIEFSVYNANESSVDATLAERGKRYGAFDKHAEVTQQIKASMTWHEGWQRLTPDQREALEMIAHKIGRIINGDPDYADSWHDIAGYAKLVEDRLNKEAR